MSAARYAYGDSTLAAKRLDVVARIFEPTTRSLLELVGRMRPPLALDLVCGPGHTTRLIGEVLRPIRLFGLDRSPAFLERARDASPGAVEFVEHDVSATPFPVRGADLIFSRLVLSHLPDRVDCVARWTTQLAPGGVLILDEIEEIRTDEPAFAGYLPMAIEAVARAGGRLFCGPELADIAEPPNIERIHDEVVDLPVSAVDAATSFAMNLAVLTQSREIPAQPELEEALARVVDGGAAAGIEWKMRQVGLRRRAES